MSKRDVSPKIKEPRKQSKKPKKPIVFSTEKNKIKINGCSMLRIKKTNTHTYIITSSRCFTKKKIKLKIRNRKSFDCAPPEKRIEKTTRTLELELPLLKITVFLFVDVSFSPKKKYPVAPWQKEMNVLTHITKSAAQNQLLYMQCPKIQCWIHTT